MQRIDASVYDLSPADFGEFDFVFMGSLLLHLQDPGRALTGRPYFVPWGAGYQTPGLRLRQLAAHNVTHMLGHLTRLGVPHMWLLARPVP